MAEQFGDSYRKEVLDANEGRLAQATIDSPAVVQRQAAGRENTKLDNRSKFTGFAEFANAAGNVATGIKQRKEQQDLDAAYANGSQAKLDALQKEEGGFMQSIFGKSATMKGFQQRVLDDEVERDYQNRLGAIGEHSRQFSTIEEYREKVGDPLLKEALSKQTDPEVRARMTKRFTENTRIISGQFAKHRAAYEQVLNRKQVLNNVLQASKTFKVAEATQDEEVIDRARSSMGKAMQKPKDMEPQAWEDTMTNALVDRIGNSDLTMFQAMEAEDKLTFFSIKNKNKIEQAKDVYTRENDTRFLAKDIDLKQQINQQDKNFEPTLAAYKKQYPQVDTNAYRRSFETVRADRAAKAQALHVQKLQAMSGERVASGLPTAKKLEIAKAVEDQVATDAAMRERALRIKDQQLNGEVPEDLNKAMSFEEKQAAIFKSPNQLVNQWRTQGIQPVLATKSLHELDSLILSDELTADDEDRVIELTNFLNHFNANPNDAALFAKGTKSKEQLANFKQLDFLMNKTGKATRKALVMMRMNKTKEVPVFDPIQSQQFASDALRDFTDNNGFENWLGWSTDPDNQADLELAAADAFDQALEITKDPAMAKNLVQDFLTFDSTRVGDKFVIGGADLDNNSYNGNFNSWVEHTQHQERWKGKQAAAGFPRDRLITDPRNTLQPWPNKMGVTITSNFGGRIIYTDLPVPTNRQDFLANTKPRGKTDPLDFNEPVPAPENPTPVIRSTPGEPAPKAPVTAKVAEAKSQAASFLAKDEGYSSKLPANVPSERSGITVGGLDLKHGDTAVIKEALSSVLNKETVAKLMASKNLNGAKAKEALKNISLKLTDGQINTLQETYLKKAVDPKLKQHLGTVFDKLPSDVREPLRALSFLNIGKNSLKALKQAFTSNDTDDMKHAIDMYENYWNKQSKHNRDRSQRVADALKKHLK